MAEGAKGKIYVTAAQLQELGWERVNDAMVKDLNDCLARFEITTPNRIRHFISQCMHESGRGKYIEEIDKGIRYEHRKDLGNIHDGDGPKYKGAGYIQLTGRDNYQKLANAIGDPQVMNGVTYVAQKYPWTSAGFWWDYYEVNKQCDLNASVRDITLIVNGKQLLGLKERETYYAKCQKVIPDR